eukprot:CAMPEP_0174236754 /NCGR_PEP_ID=MMETSP0417-20130205/5783_1 /TAXON_ID=242541 /ORGANISM="Mayorella sp, Strain BSH-02190019" /LENGTH=697 /DNA_ID=CAMNT_0015315437 /DNA_START=132 /DNA_END=2225 /DNA_ORIENTATION=-
MSRANYWVQKGEPYSQSEQAAGPDGGMYRTDCSGFVSMAWDLDAPGGCGLGCPNTDSLISDGYAIPISQDDLQQGDILDCTIADSSCGDGHTVIFAGWLNDEHTEYTACAEHEPGRPTSCESSPYPYFQSSCPPTSCFHPYRYSNICNCPGNGNCNGHGACQADGTCACDPCHSGSDCSVEKQCGHGSCVAATGQCACSSCNLQPTMGWSGPQCDWLPQMPCAYLPLVVDVNGDGLSDVVTVHRPASPQSVWMSGVRVDLAVNHSSSFEGRFTAQGLAQTLYNGGGQTTDYYAVAGDFNGDGFGDVAVISAPANCQSEDGWCANVYLALGSSSGDMVFATWPCTIPSDMHNGAESTLEYIIKAGDFNGDGMDDLAVYSRPVNCAGDGFCKAIFMAISTGKGFSSQAWDSHTPSDMYNGSGDYLQYKGLVGNFNRDNRSDLVTVTVPQKCPGESWCAAFDVDISSGSSWKSAYWNSGTPMAMVDGARGSIQDFSVLTGDLNGDGLTDLVTVGKPVGPCPGPDGWCKMFSVDLSSGDGFDTYQWQTNTPQNMYNANFQTYEYTSLACDLNGDGFTDLVHVASSPVCPGDGFCDGYYVDINRNGTGFATAQWASATPMWMHNGGSDTQNYVSMVADVNGDGLCDIVTVTRPVTNCAGSQDGWCGVFMVDLSTGTGFTSKPYSSGTPALISQEDQSYPPAQ